MFGLGVPELIIIALIILLFFGAKRLPGIGTGLGKTVKEVRNIKRELSGEKKKTEKSEPAEESKSEEKTLEGKIADKIFDKVPGVEHARKIKDKAKEIKKMVS
ncbi:MAG: twin-arginine translocase TatA/TatE family subunit [Deltaproteobacteria bacterium]|nr:twin-arginine translocase TatA/TatE family subunit [Deltaproteobacteria bacterium]MBW2259973.1 twin-arginine translocase TatA/TatE family subunit [Deltaproteobacteria bacterium]